MQKYKTTLLFTDFCYCCFGKYNYFSKNIVYANMLWIYDVIFIMLFLNKLKYYIKKDVVYNIYNGILLSHKKWNLAICGNMDGPRGYYAKWNRSDQERQISYVFIYVWNLKNKTNKQIEKK